MDEKIVSTGRNTYEAKIMTCVQTHKLFCEKIETDPDQKIEMKLYCTDVGFLLYMLDKAGEELSKLRKDKS